MPSIPLRSCLGLSSSTSQRRRVARFNRKARAANQIVGSLNEMYGQARSASCMSNVPTVLLNILLRVSCFSKWRVFQIVFPIYSEREAARSLLQSCLS